MELKTPTGSCFIAKEVYTRKKKSDKAEFMKFINDAGYIGDFEAAWKKFLSVK